MDNGHGFRLLELTRRQTDLLGNRPDSGNRAVVTGLSATEPEGPVTEEELAKAFRAAGILPRPDRDRVQAAVRELLVAVGEDPDRGNLVVFAILTPGAH